MHIIILPKDIEYFGVMAKRRGTGTTYKDMKQDEALGLILAKPDTLHRPVARGGGSDPQSPIPKILFHPLA